MYPPRYVFIRELDDFARPVVHPARDFFARTRLFHDSRNWGEKKIAEHRESCAHETRKEGEGERKKESWSAVLVKEENLSSYSSAGIGKRNRRRRYTTIARM